jgi:O-Antigen ligase
MAAAVAGALLIALLAAFASVFRVGLLPPKLEPRSLAVGGATAHAIVGPKLDGGDLPDVDALTETTEVETRTNRAALVANVLASADVVERIASQTGVDPTAIAASTQVTTSVPDTLTEPSFDVRAAQIASSDAPYRLDVQANPNLPVLDIYALAPTAQEAADLADEAITAGNAHLRDLARRQRAQAETDEDGAIGVKMTRLGPPVAATLSPRAPLEVAALTFVVVFAICIGAMLLTAAVRRGWRAREPEALPEIPDPPPPPAVGGAWPRTTRILPWTLAGFMAMLWLVPFNGIGIDASLPVDLKLDRIVLPAIVLLWLLAAAAGGRAAPSRRLTAIHTAVAIFTAIAFLSVILNSESLSNELSLDLAVKKLVLLMAYVSVFAAVASVIRREELGAFLKLNLALAVLCSIGVIWEYRSGFNVFYDVAAKMFPPIFDVQVAPSGFDDLGRQSVSGPTDHSLEVVAILSMALPIALVGLIRARSLGAKASYTLAACILGAAMISTYRKSAFIAPIAAVVTIAFLSRRYVIKLAPLAVLAAVLLPVTSFSAFGSVAGQLEVNNLNVPTVDDRVSDYDAVRPEILSNPILGRGFGSYEHTHAPTEARILDSELLLRTVDTGLVGLATFLAMIVTVIVVAAAEVRARGPGGAPVALVAAAAATAFLSLTALFDEWSFPHAPYVFMTLAGLLAVATRAPVGRAEEPAQATPHQHAHADREKRVPAHVSVTGVRHHRTALAVPGPGETGAADADVRPA